MTPGPNLHFLAARAALSTFGTDPLSESFMINHSERLMQQCARIWSDNLHLTYTSKLVTIDMVLMMMLVVIVVMVMVGVGDTLVFYLNEYFIKLNQAKLKILNKFLN